MTKKLPTIDQPMFEEEIPSTGKKILFRPFLSKEEKILLIGQQGTTADIIRSIKQVLKRCIQTDVDIDNSLTTFDLEYLFLKLRSKSVSNISKVQYRDNEDGEVRSFEINLDDIKVTFDEKNDKKIQITDKIGIIMKYPSASITDRISEFENEVELMDFFIANCVDQIYDENDVYMASDFEPEDITNFLDNLPVGVFEKIKDFFQTLPKLYHKIEYKNKEGNTRVIEFNNLRDFFMWG